VASIYPSYIEKVEWQANFTTSLERFVNGDIVEPVSKMFITLTNKGLDLDLSSIILKLNGVTLQPGPTVYEINTVTGVITVHDIGNNSGSIMIDAFSGTQQLATTMITFDMTSGFAVKNLLPHPNPYNPDDGDCIIGFVSTEAGTYDIFIYDAAGNEI